MTLKELYAEIGGDYDRAMKVLRIEKLLDKYIRKLPAIPVFAELSEAGRTMDPMRLFDSAHAIKGVCSNLGMVKLAELSEVICNEFRPGNPRTMTDEEVLEKIRKTEELFKIASEGIARYEQQ